MKIISGKNQIAIFTVIFLNCLIISVKSEYLPSPSESLILNSTNRIYSNNQTGTLINGIAVFGIFTNESSSHHWKIPDVSEEQAIFFSITPKSLVNVTVYNPSGVPFDIDIEEHNTEFLGSWIAPIGGNWNIEVNDTQTERTVNATYKIMASIPETGYNEESAIELSEFDKVANFTIAHDVHYWKVSLEHNQNGTLSLKETTPNTLEKAQIKIYRPGYFHNPELPETLIDPFEGLFTYSWNSFYDDVFFIIIKHNPSIISPLGTYNITFDAEKDLYNFETAGTIPFNQTITYRINQGFSPVKKYYFKFHVNESRVTVFIRIFGPNNSEANILEGATVEIYDGGKQKRITDPLTEGSQDVDKYFLIKLINMEADTYYLVFNPLSNTVGLFYIHFEYSLPTPFSWNPIFMILSMIIVLVLPIYLIYLDLKGKWYQTNQWSLPISIKDSYEFIKHSVRGIFNVTEIPNDSILIRVASIPFRTYLLLNFIESSENETLVFSKRIRRKIEWIIYFLIGLFIFDTLNIILFLLSSGYIHLLPIYLPNLTDFVLFLSIPTVFLVIGVLFVNVSAYISYTQIISRVNYIVQNYKEVSNNDQYSKGIDPLQAAKTINYVRVLWNQAKSAFKESNFELFVIKADAAVKNLLSTRYLQIVSGNAYSKPEFQVQVNELRKRGYDLPSDKKISHFRNLRNKIVHSSVTLDEKESVDCFAFYSTFITRLGLRPT